jgi:hypothetical protein
MAAAKGLPLPDCPVESLLMRESERTEARDEVTRRTGFTPGFPFLT